MKQSYELRFNVTSIPKVKHEIVVSLLNRFGYAVQDTGTSKQSKKQLVIGDLQLASPLLHEQVGTLLETLFALSIVKEHVKGKIVRFDELFT